VCTSCDDVDDFLCRRWGVRVSVPRHIPLKRFSFSFPLSCQISPFPFPRSGYSLWLGSGAGGGWGLLSLLILFGCYLFTFHVFASSRHQAIMGGRFWDNQVSHWSSRNWDQLALQAHNLIICNTLLAGPMWRKEIRGSSSPSLCLISYSTPTDFINGLFSLSVKALWDGNISSTTLSVSLLTFSTSSLGYLVRYTTSFAFFVLLAFVLASLSFSLFLTCSYFCTRLFGRDLWRWLAGWRCRGRRLRYSVGLWHTD